LSEPMNQSNDQSLREHLTSLLSGGNAHISFDDFVKDFPAEKCGRRVEGLPYTAWQVLEHMRIAQWDILQFSKDGRHKSPKWPEGYWPDGDGPRDAEQWNKTVKQFKADLKEMMRMVENTKIDLLAPIPGGQGQTVFREAILVADHNSYHIGQIVIVRRMLGVWED